MLSHNKFVEFSRTLVKKSRTPMTKESSGEIDYQITLGTGRQKKHFMKTSTPVKSRIQTITLWRGQGSLQDALCPLARMLAGCLALLLFFLCAAVLVQQIGRASCRGRV